MLLRDLFDKLDTNKDGRVDKKELMAGLSKDKNLAETLCALIRAWR